jgi:hypothetical protein
MSQAEPQAIAAPRPLFQASAASLLPIVAFGGAAAVAPGHTVGSVVIALMGGTLATLGGVVLSARLARSLRALHASPQRERLACLASLPMLLGATVVALVERAALGLAFAVALATLAWSHRAVVLASRAIAGAQAHGLGRAAAALAIAAHLPSLFRLALWTL